MGVGGWRLVLREKGREGRRLRKEEGEKEGVGAPSCEPYTGVSSFFLQVSCSTVLCWAYFTLLVV